MPKAVRYARWTKPVGHRGSENACIRAVHPPTFTRTPSQNKRQRGEQGGREHDHDVAHEEYSTGSTNIGVKWGSRFGGRRMY